MKKIVSLLLCLILMSILAVPALAVDNVITTADLEKAIANGDATVVNEVRDLTSFSEEEIVADEALQYIFENVNISTYSLNHNSNEGTAYKTTVTYDTDVFKYYLVCTVDLDAYDVGTASSNTLKTTLSVVESVSQNGERREDMANYIRVSRISGKLGCGENTVFASSLDLEGSVEGNVFADVAGVIGWCASKVGWRTVNEIVSSFSSINSFFNSGKATTTTPVKAGDMIRTVSAEWSKSTVLNSDKHYLTMDGTISTLDSSLTKNKTTNAVASWTYSVYYGALTPYAHDTDTVQVSTTYRVNVK